MNVPDQADVIASIDAFQARHPHIGDARFGREATGEPGLVGRLRIGSSPTLRILERIKSYMVEVDAKSEESSSSSDGVDLGVSAHAAEVTDVAA